MRDEQRQRITELVDYFTPLLVRMCAEAGVFAAFGARERAVEEVASETGLDAAVLRRVVRALAARGIFEQGVDGPCRLSALGQRFVPGSPGSLAGIAVFRPMDLHAWAEGMHALRTGEPSFQVHFGRDHWEHLAAHPELSAAFSRQMAARTTTLLDLGLEHYAWPEVGKVVDLGGGNGLLLSRVLRRQPGLRGVLFDLPHVVGGAALTEFTGRIEVVGGDLFADVLPAAGDLYILASVLHDWNDALAKRLLHRVREAMPSSARLLLFESVLPDGPEPDLGKALDLHMLMLFGAKERTADDWSALLGGAGFEVEEVIPTPGLAWIQSVPRR